MKEEILRIIPTPDKRKLIIENWVNNHPLVMETLKLLEAIEEKKKYLNDFWVTNLEAQHDIIYLTK